jgi:hypothetical protein
MRNLGNLDLLGNFLRNVGLEPVTEWPPTPTIGRFLNFNSRIYLCTDVAGTDGLPVYLPVTSTVSTYLHTQAISSNQWLISHGLNYDKPIVFIYDNNGVVIQPDDVEIVDVNTVTINFSVPVTGKAIVMCATDNLFNGGAANSGTSLPNASLLQMFAIENNHLKFGDELIQYQLQNNETLALLGVDSQGNLTYNGVAVGKQLGNADILSNFSVVNGVLQYNSQPVDTVGQTFTNADILAKLSVVNGVLYYNGVQIDTVGQQFNNSDVLAKLSVDLNGKLCYNGVEIDTVGQTFSNSDILSKFAVDVNGNLTYNGVVVDQQPTFNNKAVLDKLGVDGNGNLTYNGAVVSTEAFTNAVTLAGLSVDLNGNLTFNGQKVDSVAHTFTNQNILDLLTLDANGKLAYNGQTVDTVGHVFTNAEVLDKLTIDASNKLCYNGIEIDTVGQQFANSTTLNLFSQDVNGNLLFNGTQISFSNATVLSGLSDVGGALYYKGASLGGSVSTMTVSNTGTGQGLLSIIGNQINGKSLVAGTNVTLNSTSDSITINATLSGAVSAASTFKTSDAYTLSNTVASTAATQILATEAPTTDTGLLLLARLGSDVNSNVTGVALPATGSVTANSALASAPSGIATLFNSGKLTIANGTTYTATSPATWFAGTVDWTVECDFWRSSSNQGVNQNLISGWNTSAANSSIWVRIYTDNKIYVSMAVGTTVVDVAGSVVTDTGKHHLEVTRTGGVVRIFLDGALVGSTSFTSSINAGTGGIAIGNTVDSVAPFYGYLRNVKVYNYAKHTAAYTVAGYYADRVGVINTVDMAGKLLSSVFWKTISSMAVASTETASAYLLWMLRTGDGTVWYWDNTNKVFVADSAANILTKGVTTATLTSAMTNYGWSYKSDTIGFVIALVTTDGSSTPILTSITLNAVQSADKTAGHTVVNSTGTSMAQRTNLKFVGLGVSDDSTNNQTVVTGVTDSSGLTHNSTSMQTVLNSLQSSSGTVNGKAVDLTNLTDGSTLAYSQVSGKFQIAQPATGASGQGLYMTSQFTVNAGQEVTVNHQAISNSRAIYQADQYIAGAAGYSTNRFARSYDATLSGLAIGNPAPYDYIDPIRLPFTYGSMTKNAQASFPVVNCLGVSYVVDNTIYVMPTVQSGWATSTQIYTASTSAPTTFTVSANTTPVTFNSAQGYRVYKYNGALYVFGNAANAGVYMATLDAPTVWTQVGTLPVAFCGGFAFIIGSRVYVGAGQLNSNAALQNKIYSADMSNLSSWTTEANTFPVSIGRTSCYQYGNYLYVVGGETTLDSVYSNAIYRASVASPTVWTQIGTIPSALGSIDDLVVYGGKVFIFGGRINASTYSTTVFFADASNPVSWTTGTAMTTARQFATKYVVDDQCYIVGGFNGTWLSSIESYSFTPTSAIGSGTMTLNVVNTSLMQTLTDINIYAKIPASTSIQAAASFDGGTTWSYYSVGSGAWVVAASQAAALAAGAALTSVSGYKYLVTGLTNFNVGSMQNIQIALLLTSTVANTSPVVYYSTVNYLGIGTYGTLLIGSYGNGYADIGIKHPAGTYSTTNIKNNQSSPITMILKICDGTTTV